jgi:hypothetical protein
VTVTVLQAIAVAAGVVGLGVLLAYFLGPWE